MGSLQTPSLASPTLRGACLGFSGETTFTFELGAEMTRRKTSTGRGGQAPASVLSLWRRHQGLLLGPALLGGGAALDPLGSGLHLVVLQLALGWGYRSLPFSVSTQLSPPPRPGHAEPSLPSGCPGHLHVGLQGALSSPCCRLPRGLSRGRVPLLGRVPLGM